MKLTFPAIAVSPDDPFLVVDALPTESNVRALRNGYFSGMYFFDMTGARWPVASLDASPGLLDRLLNRRVPVQIVLGEPSSVDVATVARELCALVDRDPDDVYDQFVSHDELKRMFTSSASAAELIAAARTLGATV